MNSRLRIIVTGLIAQHPTLAGVTWDYLQYVLGLARLGHDVYYFEDTGEWPYSLEGGETGNDSLTLDCTRNIEHLFTVMDRYGLGEKWAYHFPKDKQWFGLSDTRRREVLQTADLLINVSGVLEDPAKYRQIPRLAYIDSDPVFTQVKLMIPEKQQLFRERVNAHDTLFSFGECIAETPLTAGREWLPTRQPIVLSEWKSMTPIRPLFTTVMSWTSYEPLTFKGKRYGQKDIEFLRFIDLPKRFDRDLIEVAIGGTAHGKNWGSENSEVSTEILTYINTHTDYDVKEFLSHAGWSVTDASEVGATMDSYRHYIQSSMAEWSVAKNGYVEGKTGWFSCRSACYLAAGKPVVVEDTGFGAVLPVGEGILSFQTIEEAMAGIRNVQSEYTRHSAAAVDIAAEYFDADQVLSLLIERAMNAS